MTTARKDSRATESNSPSVSQVAALPKYPYADVLRVSATMAVVVLHVAAPLLYLFNSIDPTWWWIGNAVDSSVRWSVPIFVMVSGMLLLDMSRTESTATFFRRRVIKVAIPFLVWSAIYAFLKPGNLIDGSFSFSAIAFVKDFARGNVSFHLWFFYALIGLYVITPILRVWVRHASNRLLVYFLVLWLLTTPVRSLLWRFFDYSVPVPLDLAAGWAGYFVLGHLLARSNVKAGIRVAMYLLGGAGLAVTILGTYLLTKQADGQLDEYFYNYLSASVILTAAAVFLGAKSLPWPKVLGSESFASKTLGYFSKASLGIYLVHPIFLDWLTVHGIYCMYVHPAVGIPLTFFLTFAASFVLIRLLQMIPVVRHIVP